MPTYLLLNKSNVIVQFPFEGRHYQVPVEGALGDDTGRKFYR
jgi:hypothetical protein